MSDISPFYFTLTIHLMAILMVISAIQFIGVTCLMNHVILFLWPLKMKDWLLCWIKSCTLNRMNFASEYTFSLSSPLRSKEWGMSDMSAFNIDAVLSFLAGSCLKVTVSCSQKTSFPTNRDHKIGLHITEYYTEPEHTGWCCWLQHFIIIYLWKCISRVR